MSPWLCLVVVCYSLLALFMGTIVRVAADSDRDHDLIWGQGKKD